MRKTTDILLIGYDRINLEGYEKIFESLYLANKINLYKIKKSYCSESTLIFMEKKTYDLVFLDISLPLSVNGLFKSGEDLGRLILKRYPATKILLVTSFQDSLLLNSILQFINPKGFLFKGDVDAELLAEAILIVLKGDTYYSTTISNLIHKNLSSGIILDFNDKLILYQLFKGVKTVDLKNIVHLSQSGIEKRKRGLKEIFDTKSLDDSALIKAVIKKGFL